MSPVHDGAVKLPPFGFVCVHEHPLAAGIEREAEWMAAAAHGERAVAHLWQGTPGWVVPRRTTALAHWDDVAAHHGSALQVRRSGGGLVPQGPGIWNLSLAWPAAGATAADMHAVYAALCEALAAAFARLGVRATPQAVQGSFCDGRWNLAVHGRKLVGTAQAWRRFGAQQVVLAHALIIVGADPVALTDRANALEAELGHDRPYRADTLTSLAREAHDLIDLEARTLEVLAEQFARVVPPRPAKELDDGDARIRDGAARPG
jgi:lipoate-protein ligase A